MLIEDAISIIRVWRKLKNDKEILEGLYDTNIVTFVLNSINMAGIEGQSQSIANGIRKNFYNTPESVLKSEIKQVL